MDANTIRAFIFLVAGLIVFFVPHEKIYNFQASVLAKFHIKYDEKKRGQVYSMYPKLGAVFILISLALFTFSIFGSITFR